MGWSAGIDWRLKVIAYGLEPQFNSSKGQDFILEWFWGPTILSCNGYRGFFL